MTTEETTQAVASEDNAGATPPAEADAGAQDDLETLLKEYDSVAEVKPEPEAKTDTKEVAAKPAIEEDQIVAAVNRALTTREAEEKVKVDLANSIKAIKGEDFAHLDDDFVEGFLEKKATKDPRILKAFVDRNKSPDQWNKIVARMGEDFRSMLGGGVDRDLTDSREAVTAAVRGASAKTSNDDAPLDNKTLSKMSNAELEQLKRSIR